MYTFHQDKDRYFDIQYQVTKDYIIPFIRHHAPALRFERVLEIGCAEAGVLKAFLEEGAFCTGIELSSYRIQHAEAFHAEAMAEGRIEFINRNIFDIDPEHDLDGKYDLIVLKDVIEHIPRQREFIAQLMLYLREGGMIFFAFPPWMMPYGGHQQLCRSKFLSRLPYFHLLPRSVYRYILKAFKEPQVVIDDLMDIAKTGISIERFERYVNRNRLRVVGQTHFLVNPIYKYKFNRKPLVQWVWLSRIPWLRNFLTTGVYYLIGSRD